MNIPSGVVDAIAAPNLFSRFGAEFLFDGTFALSGSTSGILLQVCIRFCHKKAT